MLEDLARLAIGTIENAGIPDSCDIPGNRIDIVKVDSAETNPRKFAVTIFCSSNGDNRTKDQPTGINPCASCGVARFTSRNKTLNVTVNLPPSQEMT